MPDYYEWCVFCVAVRVDKGLDIRYHIFNIIDLPFTYHDVRWWYERIKHSNFAWKYLLSTLKDNDELLLPAPLSRYNVPGGMRVCAKNSKINIWVHLLFPSGDDPQPLKSIDTELKPSSCKRRLISRQVCFEESSPWMKRTVGHLLEPLDDANFWKVKFNDWPDLM